MPVRDALPPPSTPEDFDRDNGSIPAGPDQAEMFARGEMKQVAFSERDIEAQMIRRYRPGAEQRD